MSRVGSHANDPATRQSTVLHGISELVTNDPTAGPGLLGSVPDAAVVIQDGLIEWVGSASLRARRPMSPSTSVAGRCCPDGWTRIRTWSSPATGRRSSPPGWPGTPYRAGGMQATVAATREATEPELLTMARRHRAEMIAGGTTCMETKTGYGLTTHDELRAARTAKAAGFDEITFLGAHVVPPEFAKDPDAYLDLVCGPMLDAVAPQVGWIDVFCETGAFDEAQTRRVLAAGTRKGLGLRVHGNQLSTGPGVRIAVDTGAASVDHCTYLTDPGHRRAGRLAARWPPCCPPATCRPASRRLPVGHWPTPAPGSRWRPTAIPARPTRLR